MFEPSKHYINEGSKANFNSHSRPNVHMYIQHTHTHTHARTHARTDTLKHTYKHTHTNTHTDTHTDTQHIHAHTEHTYKYIL